MLYAKALLPKAQEAKALGASSTLSNAMPFMPTSNASSSMKISPRHCMAYNKLTKWQPALVAVIHPCYIQTLSLTLQLGMMVTKEFPFSPLGIVHIANQIKVTHLPSQSDELHLSTSFGDVYFHKRGWLFEVVTTAYVNGKNEPAVIATSFYLARCRHKRSFVNNDVKPTPNWITRAFTHDASLGNKQQTEPLSAPRGLMLSQTPLSFNANIGRKYARISGDYNPIHLHALSAALFGFKKAIAHGMYSKALVLSNIADDVGFYRHSFMIDTVFTKPLALPCDGLLSKINNADRHINFTLAPQKKANVANAHTQQSHKKQACDNFLSGELKL